MNIDIARAWKDAQYRESLSAEEKAMLPENPAGELELADSDLAAINGGTFGLGCGTFGGAYGGTFGGTFVGGSYGLGGGYAANSAVVACVQSVALLGACSGFGAF